jgi:hypothetical protein
MTSSIDGEKGEGLKNIRMSARSRRKRELKYIQPATSRNETRTM